MSQMDDELRRFKELSLPDLAAERGYQLVTRERTRAGTWRGSTASSLLMRHPTTDDKIVLRRDHDGHWVYFSVRDNWDQGTIIDFLQRRGIRSLGEVRKELRRWSSSMPPAASLPHYRLPEEVRRATRAALLEAFARFRLPDNNLYLNSRGIRPETLTSDRFRGTWLEDERGNVIFPHRDGNAGDAVCGWEKKNRGFTGFATAGDKTIWTSRTRPDDTKLVIAEASIDAISYHQLHPDNHARYASTAGASGPRGEGALLRAIKGLPPGSICVIATDRDHDGDKYAERILKFARDASVVFRRHATPIGKDWNDCLKDREPQYIESLSRRRLGR